jgi:copper(I)-binding protein
MNAITIWLFDNVRTACKAGAMKRRAVIFLPFLATAANAHSYKVNGIAIGHAWALPAEQGVSGQVFMPIVNQNAEADALIAVRGDICATIQLRKNARYDDPPEKQFDLPRGKPLPMRPSARHLRLIGLRQSLVKGDQFSLVLDFRLAGEIEVNIFVEDKEGH